MLTSRNGSDDRRSGDDGVNVIGHFGVRSRPVLVMLTAENVVVQQRFHGQGLQEAPVWTDYEELLSLKR